jgi:hypothetical protein
VPAGGLALEDVDAVLELERRTNDRVSADIVLLHAVDADGHPVASAIMAAY